MTRRSTLWLWIPLTLLSACAGPGEPNRSERAPLAAQPGRDWITVGNNRGRMRYSPLDQINQENVASLRPAWTFSTGELERGGRISECTPIVVEGVMYLTTAYLELIALEADTGEKIWEVDPFTIGNPSGRLASGGVNRGCAYWSDGIADGEQRILHGTADGRLFSIDARTGVPDPAFGWGGWIDLRADIDRDISKLGYGPTSAPAICGDRVVLGFSNDEGPGPSAPGDVRAFDVRTGKQVWRFHTVPRPGEVGHETWADGSWVERGGANAWGGVSVDPVRQWVFVGLGSAAFDFFGGDREGENLFANSVVAIDGRTGKYLWHFQTLHHDLWDHDLPTYPNLVQVQRDGQVIDAVAQVTKTGYVFVLNRETGEPLFEVEEVPAPASPVAEEKAWPTQPVPVKPPAFCKTVIHAEDLTDRTPEAAAFAKERFAQLRSGAFMPPSLEGTLVVPGFHGGATWSGASFDPTTGLLYVNSNNVPNVVTLVEADEGAKYPYRITGYHKFLDPDGYPAIKPPWGQLSAIDLDSGEIAWQVPLGEYPALAREGYGGTGCENFGGTIVTAGGLVFIGGTVDEKFRAFDKRTGEQLWESKLPAGGYATPCTYEVDGRQYVCIAATGGGKLGTPTKDTFVAFAVPLED
ncbi:MAG: pyrroloquinoline quinone-dependent dehydrogenase [Planctomycetota bacterium]